MRKILSMVLVLTLVLGSFSFAFAAEKFSDVEDEAVLEAVQRLSAFGVVDGYEDGSYQPDKTITRAEFSKLLVTALGLDTAAEAATSTRFSDAADAWYTGYVEVAAGQGLVNGYPDGTFQPNKTVSYAEAVTMLVRSLGYKDQFLSGSWPGNYVAKAAELDITEDVTFTPSGLADRGSVAVLVNNTLDAKIISVSSYEDDTIKYSESDETLLADKLDIDKVEDIRVVATKRLDDTLDTDEVTILVLEDDTEIDDREYDDDTEVNVEFDGINVDALTGLQITGYFDDDVMVYAEVETPESNYFTSVAYEDDDGDDDDGKMWISETDKYYKFDENVKLYINNEDRTSDIDWDSKDELVENLDELYSDYTTESTSYAYGKVVLEKGNVVFVDVAVFEIINGVVSEVDEDDQLIKYSQTFDSSAALNEELDLDDYDEYTIFDMDMNEIALDDIEADDLLYFYEDADDDDIAYVIVQKADVVTGELTKVKNGVADTGQSRGKVYIDDEDISVANMFAYSLDEMDNLKALTKTSDLKDKLEDVFNEDVKVIKDIKGRVALLTTDVDATTGNYAVVIKKGDTGIDEQLKLWTETGETATYDVDDLGTDDNPIKWTDIGENDIIQYDLESNGDIDVLKLVYDASDESNNVKKTDPEDESTTVFIDVAKVTEDSVKADGTSKYYLNDTDSLYFDYSEFAVNSYDDDDDLEVLVWDDFKDVGTVDSDKVRAVIVTDGDTDDIEFLAFLEGYDYVTDDDYYAGYLLDISGNDDDMIVTIVTPEEEEVEYTITDNDDQDELEDDIGIESPIVYAIKGDAIKPKDADKADNIEAVDGVFDDKDGDRIKVSGNWYTLADDVLVAMEDEIDHNASDLEEDYPVEMLIQDGKVVIIKYDEEKSTSGGSSSIDGETIDTINVKSSTEAEGSYLYLEDSNTKYTWEDGIHDLMASLNEDDAIAFSASSDNEIYKITALEINEDGTSTTVNPIDGGNATVYGDVVINGDYVELSSMTINGDLTISGSVTNDFTADGVTVKGTTYVNGGGSSSVHFDDSTLDDVTIAKKNVRVAFEGTTTADVVTVKTSGVKLDADSTATVKEVTTTSDSYAPTIDDDLVIDGPILMTSSSVKTTVNGDVYEVELTINTTATVDTVDEAKVNITGSLATDENDDTIEPTFESDGKSVIVTIQVDDTDDIAVEFEAGAITDAENNENKAITVDLKYNDATDKEEFEIQ